MPYLLVRGSWAARNLQNTGFQSQAVKVLSWDEVGYARLLEEWTEVPVHQNARTACLTIVGMTAPVSGSVMIGQKGSIKRGCANQHNTTLAEANQSSWICQGDSYLVLGQSCMCCKVSARPATKVRTEALACWWADVCVNTHKYVLRILGTMKMLWYR